MNKNPKTPYRSHFTTLEGKAEEFTVVPLITLRLSHDAQVKLAALAHTRGCNRTALLEHILRELELEMVLPDAVEEEGAGGWDGEEGA